MCAFSDWRTLSEKHRMEPDSNLLRAYAELQDEAAFAQLVNRHIALVYSTAARGLYGDATAAKDVTQLVFIEFARKSSMLLKHPSLAAWLYMTARNICAN